MRRPVLIGSLYLSAVYGDPSMKGLVPATIRAEISKTKIWSFRVTMHSKQKGPKRPLLAPRSPPEADEVGPISNSDRKSTRLNSSHMSISYALFCLKKNHQSAQYTAAKTRRRHRSNWSYNY